jgi:maltose alpha-D-glucosyltransferase/alpha-amylase
VWHMEMPEPLPEFITLTLVNGRLEHILEGRERRQLENDVLPQFLQRQRWFGAKGETITSTRVEDLCDVGDESGRLFVVDVELPSAQRQRYLLPLSIIWGEENVQFGAPKLSYTLARVRKGPRVGALIDGAHDERPATEIVRRMLANEEVPVAGGSLRFHSNEIMAAIQFTGPPAPLNIEQSNVSIAFGSEMLLKIYRRLRAGEQPEVEVACFLTETAKFPNTPAYLGSVEFHAADGEKTMLASAFAFVQNQGDCWAAFVNALQRQLEDEVRLLQPPPQDTESPTRLSLGYPLDLVRRLGERTGEMHAAFATPTDNDAFRREPIERADIHRWIGGVRAQAESMLAALERAQERLTGLQDQARLLISLRGEIEGRLDAFANLEPSGLKSRIHGDYHLGQVLLAQQDVYIIDFEGEPGRSLEERRAKSSPLRDVAGMLRSFDYAAWTAVLQVAGQIAEPSWDPIAAARAWRARLEREFLDGYVSTARQVEGVFPGDATIKEFLELFLLEKAFYEIDYELSSRPDWLRIPLQGVLDLLGGGTQ